MIAAHDIVPRVIDVRPSLACGCPPKLGINDFAGVSGGQPSAGEPRTGRVERWDLALRAIEMCEHRAIGVSSGRTTLRRFSQSGIPYCQVAKLVQSRAALLAM